MAQAILAQARGGNLGCEHISLPHWFRLCKSFAQDLLLPSSYLFPPFLQMPSHGPSAAQRGSNRVAGQGGLRSEPRHALSKVPKQLSRVWPSAKHLDDGGAAAKRAAKIFAGKRAAARAKALATASCTPWRTSHSGRPPARPRGRLCPSSQPGAPAHGDGPGQDPTSSNSSGLPAPVSTVLRDTVALLTAISKQELQQSKLLVSQTRQPALTFFQQRG